jgi:riboflavin biosynthesis pyrimidine reductase
MERLEGQTESLIVCGAERVDGSLFTAELFDMGYRVIYNTTGPKVLHFLLSAGVLDRLYLTVANRVLGGSPFSSIVEGALLDPPPEYRLQNIYLDPHALEGSGQLLLTYDKAIDPF